jgi:hypothetical protein
MAGCCEHGDEPPGFSATDQSFLSVTCFISGTTRMIFTKFRFDKPAEEDSCLPVLFHYKSYFT